MLFLLLLAGTGRNSAAADKLNVALLEFAPYEFSREGELDGVAVEVVRETFARMDQAYEFTMLPWSRALLYLEQGRVDALFEILDKPERRAFADYCHEVLMEETVSLFVRADSLIRYDGLVSTLADRRIAVRQDFSYGEKFDAAVATGQLAPIRKVVNTTTLIRLLMHGRVDVIIGDKYGIPYVYRQEFADRASFQGILKLTHDVQVTPAYMVFSKKRGLVHVRDAFDRELRGMKQDGTYAEILLRWGSEAWPEIRG